MCIKREKKIKVYVHNKTKVIGKYLDTNYSTNSEILTFL